MFCNLIVTGKHLHAMMNGETQTSEDEQTVELYINTMLFLFGAFILFVFSLVLTLIVKYLISSWIVFLIVVILAAIYTFIHAVEKYRRLQQKKTIIAG